MKKAFLALFLIFGVSTAGSVAEADAEAGVLLYPSVTYMNETGTITGDQSVLGLNLRAGYRIQSGWFFGMIYLNTSGGGTSSINGSALGNSIGYFDGYFSAVLSYYLTAHMTENTSTDFVARTEGQGIQLDVAFTMPVASGLTIGPMLTYQNMTYSKRQDITGYVNGASQTQSFIYPSIAATYQF